MKVNLKKIPKGEIVNLSELRVGNIAKIIQVESENICVRKRLFEMGVTKGTDVEIKKFAPLGDPVVVKIRGTELCVRKSELKKIKAKVLK